MSEMTDADREDITDWAAETLEKTEEFDIPLGELIGWADEPGLDRSIVERLEAGYQAYVAFDGIVHAVHDLVKALGLQLPEPPNKNDCCTCFPREPDSDGYDDPWCTCGAEQWHAARSPLTTAQQWNTDGYFHCWPGQHTDHYGCRPLTATQSPDQ